MTIKYQQKSRMLTPIPSSSPQVQCRIRRSARCRLHPDPETRIHSGRVLQAGSGLMRFRQAMIEIGPIQTTRRRIFTLTTTRKRLHQDLRPRHEGGDRPPAHHHRRPPRCSHLRTPQRDLPVVLLAAHDQIQKGPVRYCMVCQHNKPSSKSHSPHQPLPTPPGRWHTVTKDFAGAFEKSGERQ
jgi:hypothetical protein